MAFTLTLKSSMNFPFVRAILGFAFVLIASQRVAAQNDFKAFVKDAETRLPLPGASAQILSLGRGAQADEEGLIIIKELPDGEYAVEFSFVGYREKTISVRFPGSAGTTHTVLLLPDHESLEEITVAATRSSRTIADIPTRVEFIAGEEIDEKTNMKPGDIRMLLNESTGIQTQQTSPTTANASIRIQGLDGRYTQILKDGFPLYAGFSGGLGLLQTPPLDLKQVEVIKGSSSTLYGGGAIAGLVNLVSKTPGPTRELNFLANATSARGLDLSAFYSERYGKAGVTIFVSRNSNEAYDPADIDLTAIPEFERYTINPRFFIDVSDKTRASLGVNMNVEERIGGDVHYIKGTANPDHSYFERNDSKRFSTQLAINHQPGEFTTINFKNTFNRFDRSVEIPSYLFSGIQNSSFTELNIVRDNQRTEWIGGLNLWTDQFRESGASAMAERDYNEVTFGAFVQGTFDLTDRVTAEAGLRGDYVLDYGFALLPRLSILYRANEKFGSRLGGGFGYKAPTIFTEESERIQFRHVLPVTPESHKLERSWGVNWDVNYRGELSGVSVSANHMFFYTFLNHPLMLLHAEDDYYRFVNSGGHIDTRGFETNLKFESGDFKFLLGYTLTDAVVHSNGERMRNPLTAKHRLNNVLMYEVEEQWKIGLEAYYFSRQRLNDGEMGKDYWICGFMVEKLWEHLSIFINFENFLDARQTRFDTIYTGSLTNPAFRDIYAPVDGFVINGGLKIRLSREE
jgi:iron complex outermembrane receptor protein